MRAVIVHHEVGKRLDRRNVIEILSVLIVRHQVQDLLHPDQQLGDHCARHVEYDALLALFVKADCFSQTVHVMRTDVFNGSSSIDEVSHHNSVAQVERLAVFVIIPHSFEVLDEIASFLSEGQPGDHVVCVSS